jgi:hypothetical protein
VPPFRISFNNSKIIEFYIEIKKQNSLYYIFKIIIKQYIGLIIINNILNGFWLEQIKEKRSLIKTT